MNFIEVCEERILKKFYYQLLGLQKILNIKIILHGGLSKLDHKQAQSIGLDCIKYSSSELVARHLNKDFQDNYFVDSDYTVANHKYLEENYNHYVKEQDISSIIELTDKKNKFWADHPDYFTFNHTTEKGSKIVANYLSEQLGILGRLQH
jgi:hypothetical protein